MGRAVCNLYFENLLFAKLANVLQTKHLTNKAYSFKWEPRLVLSSLFFFKKPKIRFLNQIIKYIFNTTSINKSSHIEAVHCKCIIPDEPGKIHTGVISSISLDHIHMKH